MCGRYNIIPDADAWVAAFDLPEDAGTVVSEMIPNYNVAPTRDVPIIRTHAETGLRELVLVHWGLIPFWTKDRKIGYRMINARAETVAEKPAFRAAFKKRRCLVPANGFYEWKKGASGKQPYLIRMADAGPFAFAGLWESWTNPADKTVLQSCTIIVTKANEMMTRIHDRMPVILSPDLYGRWLDPGQGDGLSLLTPCPDDWLDAYPVSTYVNSPQNNDSKCIEAIEID
ncbi:MAG: SOS response-associated peptidase [Methylococcaceae bacterium]|nr:SOS response-associated peptidase [Methylococcaceae bacterium]